MQPNLAQGAEEAATPDDEGAKASKDFEDFIYLISHDVRASVRALIELPQWILEDLEEANIPIEGSLETTIELMNRHTGRLDRMLVDLLTYSRVGRMQEVRDINLDTALTEVLDEQQLPPGFELIRDLQCTQVRLGDRDALTLLGALISNAARHHDKETGRIIVSSQVDGTDVVISVCDDGAGIEEKFREQVFDAMRTLRPRDEVEGSGMGLANVRKIASLHNGTAKVLDSPFGRGTMILVRLRDQLAPA